MQVTDAQFETVAEPPDPRFVMRVRILGSDVVRPGPSLVAQVGDEVVRDLILALGPEGVAGVEGFLTAEPPAGAELSVGFAGRDLAATGITYEPANV